LRVGAERVARNDHEPAGQHVGDLVDDVLQHGEPQREDDGTSAPQRVAVAAGGDRTATDLCGQRSCRRTVGAREPQQGAAGRCCEDDRPRTFRIDAPG